MLSFWENSQNFWDHIICFKLFLKTCIEDNKITLNYVCYVKLLWRTNPSFNWHKTLSWLAERRFWELLQALVCVCVCVCVAWDHSGKKREKKRAKQEQREYLRLIEWWIEGVYELQHMDQGVLRAKQNDDANDRIADLIVCGKCQLCQN